MSTVLDFQEPSLYQNDELQNLELTLGQAESSKKLVARFITVWITDEYLGILKTREEPHNLDHANKFTDFVLEAGLKVMVNMVPAYHDDEFCQTQPREALYGKQATYFDTVDDSNEFYS